MTSPIEQATPAMDFQAVADRPVTLPLKALAAVTDQVFALRQELARLREVQAFLTALTNGDANDSERALFLDAHGALAVSLLGEFLRLVDAGMSRRVAVNRMSHLDALGRLQRADRTLLEAIHQVAAQPAAGTAGTPMEPTGTPNAAQDVPTAGPSPHRPDPLDEALATIRRVAARVAGYPEPSQTGQHQTDHAPA
jgi:hypothetical protein